MRTLVAHTYGQAINVATTILLPYVAVTNWGAAEYGVWISITAVTQLLLLIDLGWGNAIQNQLCMKSNRGIEEATFLTTKVANNYLAKLSIAVACLVAMSILISQYKSTIITTCTNKDLAITIFLLSIPSILSPINTIYCGIWRYLGQNEKGITAINTVRLIETSIVVITIISGKNIIATSFLAAIFRIISSIVMIYDGYRRLKFDGPHLDAGQEKSILVEVESIRSAAKGFTMLAASQYIFLNGPVIIITSILGPVAAASFTACRTLSRLPILPLAMFLSSLSPELTKLSAAKNTERIKTIVPRVATISAIIVATVSLLTMILTTQIEELWFNGKLQLDSTILFPLCVGATILAINQVTSQALQAINQTTNQGRMYIINYSGFCIFMFSTIYYSKQACWSGYSLLIAELMMALLLFKEYNKIPSWKTEKPIAQ